MARPKSDIDLRIVHAARKRFLHDGVDGASLREIAKAANTSIGMIYYYFPTKDDLFLAVVEEMYARLLPDLERALAPDAPVEERLRRMFARMAEMSDDEFIVLRLALREIMVSSKRRQRLIQRIFAGHVPLLLQALADGMAQGKITPRPPIVMAMGTFALSIFPQILRRLAAEQLPKEIMLPDPAELASSLGDILLHGIAKT
jgi:AcrR family transcriptional regulator